MDQSPLFSQSQSLATSYNLETEIILHHGDSKDFIQTIPDNSVSLIITSPPYNLGKAYENKISLENYLESQEKIIKELYRILKDQGSICWQVGNFVKDGEVYPLDIFYYNLFKQLGFFLRNRIIWYFGHGLHASKRFSGRYETILWFSKSNDYIFNLDPVRIPSKYPGKRHFKGKNIGKPSGNPLGKNPSDVWEFLAQEWDELLWDIPNVKSNHPEKTAHPCQYPIELVERCVLALTNQGDLVFDPYAGVGSSLIASIMHQRRAMGCEKSAEYIKIAQERIEAYRQGTLKIRPLGKPIHQPTGQEKVAQIPQEWQINL
jgi:site-specific DNA-methyltransferase (adenine-specific)/adenine-specific DNA-methyltransferase